MFSRLPIPATSQALEPTTLAVTIPARQESWLTFNANASMQSKAKNIPEYVATLSNDERGVITILDRLVRVSLPTALASMKYGMPTYELNGRYLALNAQKQYFSIYVDPELLDLHRAKLKGLSVGKSCVRFKRLDQAPLEVLKTILKAYLNNDKSA